MWTPGLGWHPIGFTKAAIRAIDKIIDVLPDKKTPIYIDGHSLGAGVSAISAAFLARNGYNIKAGRFFAIPRVGRLKSLRGKDVIAYRYGDDIITWVPPFFKHDIPIKQIGVKLGPINSHDIDNYVAEICGE